MGKGGWYEWVCSCVRSTPPKSQYEYPINQGLSLVSKRSGPATSISDHDVVVEGGLGGQRCLGIGCRIANLDRSILRQ